MVLAVLWLSGKPAPIPDLRLSAPVVAHPGTTIGIRAWQLDEDDLGQVTVRAPSVRVELRDAGDEPTELAGSGVVVAHGRVLCVIGGAKSGPRR